MSRNVRIASVTVTAAVIAALAFVIPQRAATSPDDVRAIHLVIRDMAYHLYGQNEPNPTLRLRRGERVQIVVTNQDAGMKHDFGVDAWRQRTRLIDGVGEARVEFVAPAASGQALYSCTPHGALMRGTIRVE